MIDSQAVGRRWWREVPDAEDVIAFHCHRVGNNWIGKQRCNKAEDFRPSPPPIHRVGQWQTPWHRISSPSKSRRRRSPYPISICLMAPQMPSVCCEMLDRNLSRRSVYGHDGRRWFVFMRQIFVWFSFSLLDPLEDLGRYPVLSHRLKPSCLYISMFCLKVGNTKASL